MNKIGKFRYFPSFAAGEFGIYGLYKNYKFKDKLTCRFYSDEFPEEFRYTDCLVTAGHNMKFENHYQDMGFKRDVNLVMGDSGGFQISSGATKWKPELKEKTFHWLENNSDIAINLDIPPRLKLTGKFQECFDISYDNFKYFNEHQTGKTKFLNVIQGEDFTTYNKWYTAVKDFDFQGWSVGGAGGNFNKFMSSICTLLAGKEHEKKNVEYIHILGTSRIKDFFMLLQLQKSLEDIGSHVTVTTDSSSPDRSVAFGTYYMSFSLKKGNFDSITMPRDKHLEGMEQMVSNLKYNGLYGVNEFDRFISNWTDMEDVTKWNYDAVFAIRLHNFYLFLDAIQMIEQAVYGLQHNLEQMMDKDLHQVLVSIDEMVKSDNPKMVFDKYTPLYTKLSNTKTSKTLVENNFWDV